ELNVIYKEHVRKDKGNRGPSHLLPRLPGMLPPPPPPPPLLLGKPQFNLGTWVRNADPVVSSATVANRVAVATCPRRVPSVLINVVFIMV
ncbi:hypothetical protein OIU85_024989, partial [Salix viminalis]